jgi:hypothetical protein
MIQCGFSLPAHAAGHTMGRPTRRCSGGPISAQALQCRIEQISAYTKNISTGITSARWYPNRSSKSNCQGPHDNCRIGLISQL